MKKKEDKKKISWQAWNSLQTHFLEYWTHPLLVFTIAEDLDQLYRPVMAPKLTEWWLEKLGIVKVLEQSRCRRIKLCPCTDGPTLRPIGAVRHIPARCYMETTDGSKVGRVCLVKCQNICEKVCLLCHFLYTLSMLKTWACNEKMCFSVLSINRTC